MKQIKIATLTSFDEIASKAKFIPSGNVEFDKPPEDDSWEEIAKFLVANPCVIVTQSALDIPNSVSTVLREPRRGRYYILPEPNPVTLHLNEAIELYNESKIKHTELKGIPLSNFHWQFYAFCTFFRKKSTAIIILATGLECFLNQIIPENEPIEFLGSPKSRGDLEWLKFKQKVKEFPQSFYGIKFHELYQVDYTNICELIVMRNDLIHLKNFKIENKTKYKDINNEVLKFDFEKKFKSVASYINTIKPKLIEFEEE